MPNNFYDEEYEDMRQWAELTSHPFFGKLVDKINAEKAILQKEIDKLTDQPSFDGAIKSSALGKAKQKLNDLLLYFEFVKQKKSHLDKRNVDKKTVFPSIK